MEGEEEEEKAACFFFFLVGVGWWVGGWIEGDVACGHALC